MYLQLLHAGQCCRVRCRSSTLQFMLVGDAVISTSSGGSCGDFDLTGISPLPIKQVLPGCPSNARVPSAAAASAAGFALPVVSD